jgi:hypothetical protein
MQKVIVVNVISSLANVVILKEIDLPEVNKLLSDGYKVVGFHQILNETSTTVTMTFILEKV